MTESSPLQQAVVYVLKLVLLTFILSFAVKYGGPYLQVPKTPALALALVLTPTTIVAALLYRLQRLSD